MDNSNLEEILDFRLYQSGNVRLQKIHLSEFGQGTYLHKIKKLKIKNSIKQTI